MSYLGFELTLKESTLFSHSLVVLTVPRGLLIFTTKAHSYRKSTECWNLKVAKKSRQNGDACLNGSQFKMESIET